LSRLTSPSPYPHLTFPCLHSTFPSQYNIKSRTPSPTIQKLHIGPYAEKTGTKANTIVKRLSEIKKRNGLNIITTTNAPGDAKSYTTPKPRATNVKPKRERVSKPQQPTSTTHASLKLEPRDAPALHGLPSPPASAIDTPLNTWTSFTTNTNSKSAVSVGENPSAYATMSACIAQKRSAEGIDDDGCDEGSVLKKAKTETWSFS
jgi:hypothetical protein